MIEMRDSKKAKTNARLTKEVLQMPEGMHEVGLMDDAAYRKITMRHSGEAERVITKRVTPKEIRRG